MMQRRLSFDELIAEIRKCSESDTEFAQQVALACITILERHDLNEKSIRDVISEFFHLA